MLCSASPSQATRRPGLLAVETAGRGGLGLLTVVSTFVLLGTPVEGKAGRHSVCVHAASSSIEWVAIPQVDVALTAAPAVTTPTQLAGSPPEDRDPMVIAIAVIDHHHLVVLSLRGGLYGP